MSNTLEKLRGLNKYEVLGLQSWATPDEIKYAYRDIARVYHPDSNFYSEIVNDPPKPEHVEIFKIVTAAYEVLIDPVKRAEYDTKISSMLNDWHQKNIEIHTQEAGNSRVQTVRQSHRKPTPRTPLRSEWLQHPKSAFDDHSILAAITPSGAESFQRVLLFLGFGMPAISLAIVGLVILFRS